MKNNPSYDPRQAQGYLSPDEPVSHAVPTLLIRTLIDRRTDDERKALKDLVRRMREDRNGD